MCAEALTALLNNAEQSGLITPAPIGRVYGRASSQVLNKEKSSIFFSRNTNQGVRDQVLKQAEVNSCSNFERYLGLPALVGRRKIAEFHNLVDRTWSPVTNWKAKFLSTAGKEVLLKVVLQAIPTYSMSIFLIPSLITRKLNQLLRKFWWGYNEESSKIQWVNWKQISHSKESGGLGFRDFRSFNLALLSKQGWRILQNPTSLAAKVLKQKYFSKTNLLEAQLGSRPSFAWRGIQAGLRILKKGLLWRVGSGSKVHIWKDSWVPSLPAFQITSPRPVDCRCD
ncbi:uncharacterized mitochondrial protein AtMg00310-like [Carya illinoinensis]|uniref:uncharacterized mitochondrial protein AtMg00310-like n=1 Tax=Carya illinoinensis TaxID=32201 RepID=UPI001C724627|nr:uncharacterized mitochondrial protein AtMg00310-like [Carya illinoinensis]